MFSRAFVLCVCASQKRAVRDLALSAEDVYQLRALCAVLRPLCLAMQGMGGETYCSVSIVLPLLTKMLDRHLVAKDTDTPLVHEFKSAAHADLKERYQLPTVKTALMVATYLDPRYEDFKFVADNTMRREAVTRAQAEVKRVVLSMGEYVDEMQTGGTDDSASRSNGDSEPEPPTKRHKADQQLYDFINDDGDDAQATDGAPAAAGVPLEERCDAQLSSYAMECAGRSVEVFQFWKTARDRYKDLAVVAVKYLTVPATSVPSERLFSTAGLVVSKLRASMSPELVGQILFLNKNAD